MPTFTFTAFRALKPLEEAIALLPTRIATHDPALLEAREKAFTAHVFVPIQVDSDAEASVGFAHPFEALRTAVVYGDSRLGPLLSFAVRRDTRRVPPSVLNQQLDAAVKEIEAREQKPMSMGARKDLGELMKKQLLKQAFPSTQRTWVLWNPDTLTLLVAAPSGARSTRAVNFMQRVFDENFTLCTPIQMASELAETLPEVTTFLPATVRHLQEKEIIEKLMGSTEQLWEGHPRARPVKAAKDEADTESDDPDEEKDDEDDEGGSLARDSIGSEFLLWLTYVSEVHGGRHALVNAKGEEVDFTVFYSGAATMRSPRYARSAVLDASASDLAEFCYAALGGALPTSVSLHQREGELSTAFILDWRLQVRKVAFPASGPGVGAEEKQQEQALWAMHLVDRVQTLFKAFLGSRRDGSWEGEHLPGITEWMLDTARPAKKTAGVNRVPRIKRD